MDETTTEALTGYNQQTFALDASRRACTTPGLIEFADGSWGGKCDDTIETVLGRDGAVKCVRSWAMTPRGCVEIHLDHQHGTWTIVEVLS